KTSGYDMPRYPVLQMLWGIITSINVDYAELMWEEFVQAIQTFLTDKANLGSPTKKATPFHLAKEDLRLGNLKFVPKGEDEVFGMPIPNELISNNIRNASYYNAYLEMVSKHDQKVAADKGGKKKPATAKQLKSKLAKEKSSKPAPAPKPKVTQVKPTKPSPTKHSKLGKVLKTRKGKSSLQLIDEDEPTQLEPEPEPKHQREGDKHDVERAIQMNATRPLPIVERKGKAIATEEQAAQSLLDLHTPKSKSTTNQFIFQRWTPATEEASTGPSAQPLNDASANIVCETPSPADTETSTETKKVIREGDTEILNIGEEQEEDVDNQVYLEEQTAKLDEGQAGSNPDPGKSHVAVAGPNPEPMHDDFVATVYPKVHESLKFLADEQVILEDPSSSSRTLSSVKNLDDTYTFGDQFFNNKSTKDKPGKHNVDAEVVSIVIVPIHQASTSVPPLSTPIIDLSSPKTATSPLLKSFTAATTETTTTNLPLPPPPQQQSTTDSEVFDLELQVLPHKTNQTVNKVFKEAVHIALQAPLKDRFRELPEADMKEILHQGMFESGSYKSLLEHVALYEALEASMEWENKDEFLAKKTCLPAPHSEHPVKDVPIPDDVNISDSEDIDAAHLPKIKTRPDWLKPVPKEDIPETPEPDWIIHSTDLPEDENK
nr:histone deacetylase 14 [Tanacetum cinerariifolium]